VIVAFTTARFAAMGFNRIVDREIDALKSAYAFSGDSLRTMSVREAGAAVVIASVVFFVAAWQLNTLCPRTLTVGARVGSVLQLHEAIHTLVAPGAWRRSIDRAGRRISGDYRPVE